MGEKRIRDDQWRSDPEIRHNILQNGSSSSRMNPEETPHEASLENMLQQMVQGLSMNTQILHQNTQILHQMQVKDDKLKELEEKYEKMFKKMEEKNEKKFKEMEDECEVMKEELKKLKDKDNGVACSSGYSSPARRTQPDHSQQRRLNLKILSEMKDKSYKGKNIRTKTMDCVEVGLFDGDRSITHDHHLLSAKVKLVILKEEFYKDDQDYWSKEDFMKALKRHGEGNTLMRIENCTFNLTSGYARHPGAIILDNSNRKAVRLGVMIAGPCEERVLEGISTPFKVQEAKTDKTKPEDDISADNGQHQQAPRNNRSQPTTAQSASENDEILAANGQQQQVPMNNRSQHTIARSASENDEILAANGQQQQVPMNNRSQHTISRSASENGEGNMFAANHQQQSYRPFDMNNWSLPTIARSVEYGQGPQSFPLPEINSVQTSLYQLTGNGKILSVDSRQNLQPNSMSVPLASTSHTAVTHNDSLSLLPFTTGQGVEGCYQQSFQQNCMDNSHDTAMTRNGHGESSQTPQYFGHPLNMYLPGNSSAVCGGNGIPSFPIFQIQSTNQQDGLYPGRAEYAGGLHPETQNQVGPNMQSGNGGPIIFNRVQLLWDQPDVEPPRCWNILDKLMPLFPDKRLVHEYDRLLAPDYFLKTMMRVQGTVGIANRSMQRHHNRGVLIQSIEDSDPEHGSLLKTKRQASYQLGFVNKACREYYIREQIKADDGGHLKVALYNEDNLRITSGPLSSASVEIVLLHGDFNADGQDYWSQEEFGNYMLCPLSEEEPPALGGDCVLTLVDGEASLSSASFQKTSSFARTGKFTMGVKMKTTLEQRVQEGITQPVLVQSHQDEGDTGNIDTVISVLSDLLDALEYCLEPKRNDSNYTCRPGMRSSDVVGITAEGRSCFRFASDGSTSRSLCPPPPPAPLLLSALHPAPSCRPPAAMSGSYSSRLRAGASAGAGLGVTTVQAVKVAFASAALAAATSLAGVALPQLVSGADAFLWKLYLGAAASPVDEGVVSPGSAGSTESEEDAGSSTVAASAYIASANTWRSVELAPAPARKRAVVERGLSLPPPPALAAMDEHFDGADNDDDLDVTWNAIMQKTRPSTAPALSSSSPAAGKKNSSKFRSKFAK